MAATVLNSLGFVAAPLHAALLQLDSVLLALAMAALGWYSSVRQMRQAGLKPLLLGALLSGTWWSAARRSPGVQRHLRRIYIDPMTGKSEWGLIRVAGRIVGIHSLSDRKPIKRDHFDAEDAACRNKEKYSEWTFTYPPDLLLRGDGGVAPGSVKSTTSMRDMHPEGSSDGANGGKLKHDEPFL